MKVLILIISISFTQGDNIIGIWKSLDDDNIKYLNFKNDGNLIEVGEKNIVKYNFQRKNDFIQIKKENGNVMEESFYFSSDTLIIQSIKQGIIVRKKFIREKLAL